MIALGPKQYNVEKPFIAVEKLVCDKIEEHYGLILKKLKMNYHVDFAAFDEEGTLRCFGEIKCRYFEHNKYETAMVSAFKYLGIKEIADTFNLPVFLYCQYTDKLMYWRYNLSDKISLKWGGREDRNSHKDIEPMCHIPMRYFQEL
tara:strand:- start:6394 stop:6831 length:438 start_codon:yes stop_codon:yes gene_type:complete